MTHLAKEFGLSDVALHKVCKKHDVPKPPLGWWARKAAGKVVKQTPLPRANVSTAKVIAITASEQRSEPHAIAAVRENAQVLASSLEQESSPTPNAIVDRTSGRLRKAKPNAPAGLVSVEGAGLIK